MRLVIAVAGAAVLFFCHLVAAMAFAGIIASFEAWALFSSGAAWGRRIPANLTSLAALAVAFALLQLAPHAPGHDFDYVHTASLWALLRWKVIIFAELPLGGPLLGILLLAACGGIIAVLVLLARPAVRFPRAAWAPIIALALLALATPEVINGGSLFDERLAYLPVLLAGAALQIAWRARAKVRIEWVLVATSLLHAAILAQAWRKVGDEFARYDTAVAAVPPGSIMLTARGGEPGSVHWTRFWAEPYTAIATRAVYRGIFAPSVFADPFQQPVALRPDFKSIHNSVYLGSDNDIRSAAAEFAALCQTNSYSGVFVTIIYPIQAFPLAAVYTTPHVLILDGCRFAASYGLAEADR